MTSVDPLPWLLEPENPSARYLALTELLDRPAHEPEVLAIRSAIPDRGPARAILHAQWPTGYWMRPGVGYSPKYKATVWQVIFLAMLGAPQTEAIGRACTHVLDHSRLPDGRFSAGKTAQSAVACLNGNIVRAMMQLGCKDPRLEESLQALAETVARDGFLCRFNATKPLPARMRDGLPCAWGAIKALGAFAQVPEERRSPAVQTAIEVGVSFLLSRDPATGDYPTATSPSPLWHKIGFPLGYTSDLAEALEVLGRLGMRKDSRLAPAVAAILSKQGESGRWALDYTPDHTWTQFGEIGLPNKWATLRALIALKHSFGNGSYLNRLREVAI